MRAITLHPEPVPPAPGDADAHERALQRAAAGLPHHLRAGTLQLRQLPPLALYVHLPWCLRKCPYCDFNSHARRSGQGEIPQEAYVRALLQDLETALPLVWGRTVHSVFLGGGTPSLFAPRAVDELLGGIRARLRLSADAEVTLEANPGSFERERFAGYAAAGVNRLSIGVQSFDDAMLQRLGRVHDAAQARAAIDEAARVMPTFNIDLMFALPGQSLEQARHDLRQALSFEPPHLSLYQLNIEPQTAFDRRPPPDLPESDAAADMQQALAAQAEAAGLARYEVSAYARAGHASRHNRNYWEFGDYLGIGAGAHSKLSFAHRVLRQTRHAQPDRYMAQAAAGAAVDSEHEVARGEMPFEFLLNALRLREGFEPLTYSERTGLPLSSLQPGLRRAADMGLLDVSEQRIAATPRGWELLNEVLQMFLPDEAPPRP